MAQFARPDGNVTQTSFTNGFAEIDEASPSDADFAYGANNTAAELEVSLGNATDPALSTGHTFRYRVAKTNAGTVDGGGNSVTVTARLMQGTTQIATDTAKTATGTWTQYALTLSGSEADAITNYTDLRLEFVTSASGGSPANRRGGAVSWAELEVPSAPLVLTADPGSFSLTGTAAGVRLNREVAADPGSVVITGTDATLTIESGGITLVADPGSVAITGTAAGLLVNREVAADPGAVAITGTAAGLLVNRRLAADPGSVGISGQSAGLYRVLDLAADPGSLALVGTAAVLLWHRRVAADPGSLVITGTAAGLTGPGGGGGGGKKSRRWMGLIG